MKAPTITTGTVAKRRSCIKKAKNQKRCRNSLDNKLSFGKLDIIELPYTLGDNPGCSSGVPLAVGDELLEKITFDVEYFEQFRPRRKSSKELQMSKQRRYMM